MKRIKSLIDYTENIFCDSCNFVKKHYVEMTFDGEKEKIYVEVECNHCGEIKTKSIEKDSLIDFVLNEDSAEVCGRINKPERIIEVSDKGIVKPGTRTIKSK